MTGRVYQHLMDTINRLGAGYLLLIDPDRADARHLRKLAESADESGVDAFLVGTSILMDDSVDRTISVIREVTNLPVILFPGASHHLSGLADAILFMSLISGRNPEFLIGEQVKAAPMVKKLGLEVIPTGYMLVDGGSYTSVEFMSRTMPIPRDKNDIACAHALAAQYLGKRCLYLEAGSGARHPVPDEMIKAIKEWTDLPLIVGGGIKAPAVAARKVRAGADLIVTGTVFEGDICHHLLSEFADAIHTSRHRNG